MWRVTHRVHLPTIALGVLWIIHSLATTMYVPWQNHRQRAALESVQSSIEMTLQIQERLSRLHSQADTLTVNPATSRSLQELSTDVARLQGQLTDPESRALLARLATILDSSLSSGLNQTEVRDLSIVCQQLIRSEQTLLLQVVDQRSRTDVVVMVVRAVLLLLGLAVGLGLAMWMSHGLKQSLSQISVSLKSAEGDAKTDLGRIDLVSEGQPGELAMLETQVQNVVRNIRDVADELHRTRQEMVRAEQLAAVGEVAAGVAHEIRNPLTSVKLLIQRAAERKPVHSLNEEQLQVLLEEVSRMENTVQGLLDFARPERTRNVECELSEIVSRTLRLLDGRLEQHKITVKMSNDGSPIRLSCDPGMIRQVVVNIVINAIDSMPDGGVLTVRNDVEDNDGWAVVEFEDTGPGIDPGVIERLFEPFVTTRANGSGLGLAISKRLIEEHGGTLAAMNSAAGGAIFKIRLPMNGKYLNHEANI